MEQINDTDYKLLKHYLMEKCGITIPENKRYLFKTRLMPRIKEIGCNSYNEFYDLLISNNDYRYDNIFIESMVTSETSFFRDEHPYHTLKNNLIPSIMKKKNGTTLNPFPRIRIWSVACSTGQEPYSIAMTISDFVNYNPEYNTNQFSIVATDISEKSLEYAKNGNYKSSEIERGVSKQLLERYFEKKNNLFSIKSNLKTIINFQKLNLIEATSNMGFFDIIICRNVLIYFSIELKTKIINNFESHLSNSGILLLGSSESLYDIKSNFKSKRCGETLFYSL